MKEYLKNTWKNKLVAILIMAVGCVPIWLEGDATILVLTLILSIPLFFTKQNILQ